MFLYLACTRLLLAWGYIFRYIAKFDHGELLSQVKNIHLELETFVS